MPQLSCPAAGIQLEVPAHPDSIALARDAVRDCVSVPRSALPGLLIIVSELVTNAVRHAGLAAEEMVMLALSFPEGSMRVEVSDRGRGFDRAQVEVQAPTSEGGFGLRIVAKLSRAWGVGPAAGLVWAEVAL